MSTPNVTSAGANPPALRDEIAALLPPGAPPEVVSMIAELDAIAVEDSTDASYQIMAGILAASSEEDILKASEAATVSAENYIEIPFLVRHDNVQWRRSAKNFVEDGGFLFYALVRTLESTGQEFLLNIGGWSTAPTLFAFWKHGILKSYEKDGGMPLVIQEVKMRSGYDLQVLRKASPNGKRATVSHGDDAPSF